MSLDRTAYRLNPYLSLGLQRNPFVLEEGWETPRSLWLDRGYSEAPLPGVKQLVQIIGVKGAGKTSHLRRWQTRTGGPYCYYPPGWRRLKMPEVARIAYWDEADRIPLPCLLVALAAAAGDRATIVAGTHQDLSLAARIVQLPVKTIQIKPFSAQLLSQWVMKRIEAVRIPGMVCSLSLGDAKAQDVATIASGSWREAADLLHIWAAEEARLSKAAVLDRD